MAPGWLKAQQDEANVSRDNTEKLEKLEVAFEEMKELLLLRNTQHQELKEQNRALLLVRLCKVTRHEA
jgi:hypothetical protein